MRILVLGGTGFIGPPVVRALADHDLAVFTRGLAGPPPAGVEWIRGDRLNLTSYIGDFRRFQPDVILDMSPQNGDDAIATLAASREVSPRLVALSSGSVYRAYGVLLGLETGGRHHGLCMETSPLRSWLFPYRGATPRPAADPLKFLDTYDKIPAERKLLEARDLSVSILRLPLVYGPPDPEARITPYLARMLAGARRIPMHASAIRWRNSRSHLQNVAQAVALVTTHGASGAIYNVAEPEDLSEGDWVRRIGRCVDWPGVVVEADSREPAVRPSISELPPWADFGQDIRLDSRKIRRDLGYAEVLPSNDALAQTVTALTGQLRRDARR